MSALKVARIPHLVIGLAFGIGLAQASAQSKTSAKPSVDDNDGAIVTVSSEDSPAERTKQAWAVLMNGADDTKHPQTRVQAMAALGMLRNQRVEEKIIAAMSDPNLDIRTAAVLAASESRDRNLTSFMRDLLDDKEPQVAFTAAMALWKMGDRSGEDILMAVVDGERSATPTLVNGTRHTISKDLHDPSTLARIGALEGASLLLGPFGIGITAYEYIQRNGGDLSRVQAVEALSEEHIEPVRHELVEALADKDPAVRTMAAKSLASYRDHATSMALYGLLSDEKAPVRLTAAAAYLRTTGVPGPLPQPATTHPVN